jgi:hypothetical protein
MASVSDRQKKTFRIVVVVNAEMQGQDGADAQNYLEMAVPILDRFLSHHQIEVEFERGDTIYKSRGEILRVQTVAIVEKVEDDVG